MTDKLPANLLALFAPRPPLRYLPHCDYAPDKRRTAPIAGVAAYLEALRTPDPDYVPTESWMQRRDRLREEKKAAITEKTKAALSQCMVTPAPILLSFCVLFLTSFLSQPFFSFLFVPGWLSIFPR